MAATPHRFYDSDLHSGVETKCATPKFSLAEGKYYNPVEIKLTTSTADAKIMYSINGAALQNTQPLSHSAR